MAIYSIGIAMDLRLYCKLKPEDSILPLGTAETALVWSLKFHSSTPGSIFSNTQQ